MHEQITKEIEERKYLNECAPFGHACKPVIYMLVCIHLLEADSHIYLKHEFYL